MFSSVKESVRNKMADLMSEVADNLLAGVIVFDKDFRVVAVNQRVRQVLKVDSLDDMIGQDIREVNRNVSSERMGVYRQVMRTGEPQIIVDEVDHPMTGKRLWQIQVIKVGEGFAVISEDVTEKDAYHQLAQQNVLIRKLKQEIAELQEKLQSA
jgi:PAS domain-containing protein